MHFELTAPPVKTFFCCTGIGHVNRGFESFFREAFDGLKETAGLELTLYKGAGEPAGNERVPLHLPRTTWLADQLGRRIGRNGYVLEQWSSFPAIAWEIRRERPAVVFYSDANLGFLLYRFRKYIGVPFRLLFSNGGPCHPPFVRTDFVQQVAPVYLEEALTYGEPPQKHSLVPYGIDVPAGSPPLLSRSERRALRLRLNLPEDRTILLSVGWISAVQKRMDYLVEELALLPQPRPFLVVLGAMDAGSQAIIELACARLGGDNFAARSVPYAEVADYYLTADAFALASLKEGFGRVYLEALINGLPTMVDDNPVTRYVLGDEGTYGNFTRIGALAGLIGACNEAAGGRGEDEPEARKRRRESVRSRFSWPVLAPLYRAMFEQCAEVSASLD